MLRRRTRRLRLGHLSHRKRCARGDRKSRQGNWVPQALRGRRCSSAERVGERIYTSSDVYRRWSSELSHGVPKEVRKRKGRGQADVDATHADGDEGADLEETHA